LGQTGCRARFKWVLVSYAKLQIWKIARFAPPLFMQPCCMRSKDFCVIVRIPKPITLEGIDLFIESVVEFKLRKKIAFLA